MKMKHSNHLRHRHAAAMPNQPAAILRKFSCESSSGQPSLKQQPHLDAPSGLPDDGLPSFDDLQPLFDDSSRRLAALLDRPEAKPTTLNGSDASTFRCHMFRAWAILAMLCVITSLYWAVALWQYNYDIYVRLFSIFLELVFLALSADAVSTTLAILRHDPALVGLDSMLRHARRIDLLPAYLQLAKPRQRHSPATRKAIPNPINSEMVNSDGCRPTFVNSQFSTSQKREQKPSSLGLCRAQETSTKLILNSQNSIANFTRTISFGLVASVTLIFVSCSTTVGDNLTLTQNHHARLESIATVTNILNNI